MASWDPPGIVFSAKDRHPADYLDTSGYFLILQVMTIGGGLVLPFMAPLVRRVGVVAAGHDVLWILWPLVTLSWTLRLIGLKESPVGRASMARSRPRLKEVLGHIRLGLQGTGRILSALRVLVQVPVVLFATFAPLALVARHGSALAAHQLAFLPIAGALAAIGLGILHAQGPHRSPRAMILLAVILLLAGFGTLASTPPHNFLMVMVGWMLVIAGQSQFWTSHTSYWMTSLPDLVRVEIQGWTGVVTASLVAILSPLIAGIYAREPRLILVASAGICLGAGLLAAQLPKSEKTNADSR